MKRLYYFLPSLDDPPLAKDGEKPQYQDESEKERRRRKIVPEDRANLVSSIVAGTDGDWHMPVLDIDSFEVAQADKLIRASWPYPKGIQKIEYVASSTEGHCHAFIEDLIRAADYWRLLERLAVVGVLEPGYVRASLSRKATFVRKPGVFKKEKAAA